MPSLVLCLLPVHTFLPEWYCRRTEPLLSSDTNDSVLAERSGRYATPFHLGLVALYIRWCGADRAAFARAWLIRRPRLPTPSQAALVVLAGFVSHRGLECALDSCSTESLQFCAATAVSHGRHGLFFERLEANRAAGHLTSEQRSAAAAERWLFSIKIGVLAPLLEEVLHRCLVLRNLCVATRSLQLGAALSSAGFGVAHGGHLSVDGGELTARVPLVEGLFGLIASAGYLVTGRLAVPIALHAMVNGRALVAEAPAAIPSLWPTQHQT